MSFLRILGATVALGALCAPSVSAAPAPGPKRPGPSAVIAALLKKSPPPNYLAHYLPDDRYKIAGGVWKYVSTDLDTYYHIASSPNMLRQPANRVIGFASARDAEEAGYIADPTDGTAAQAKSGTFPAMPSSASVEVVQYLERVGRLIDKYAPAEEKLIASAKQVMAQNPEDVVGAAQLLRSVRPAAAQYVALWRNAVREFDRLPTPASARSLRSTMRSKLFIPALNYASLFQQGVQTGNMSKIGQAILIRDNIEKSFGQALHREVQKIR